MTSEERIKSLTNMLQDEKLRADLLQKDLDMIDELHFDVIATLHHEIAILKKQLKQKGLH